MRMKDEIEKTGLKLNIQKTEIMASSPINSWQTEREKVEAVTGFTFLGSKITVNGDCSHEIKRCLLLGRKTVTNLGSILKSGDITLPTVFPSPPQISPVFHMHPRCCTEHASSDPGFCSFSKSWLFSLPF